MATVVLVPLLTAEVVLQSLSSGRPDTQAKSRGRDAVWLGHAWVDGRRNANDLDALSVRVRSGGIRDLFIHSGPLRDDGGLDPALHPGAAWAVQAIHSGIPGVRVQAWLGQRVDPGRLDLSNPKVRGRVVEAARSMLSLGFDGVHYNFEPVSDGDTGLLELLDATRRMTLSRNAMLSMSAHHVEPLPGMSQVDDILIGHAKWWSPRYLTEVASRVDQVAVMSYDTALPSQRLYTGYVRRQTEVALDAVPESTDLLMGVPAYHDDTWAHRSTAETVTAAVRGIRLAIGSNRRQRFGVAIYADFSASDSDWRAYYLDWVRTASR